jgi:hypothetical protein
MGIVSRCRVNYHPGRLVDNNEIQVFIKDIQRDGLGIETKLAWRRDVNPDLLSTLDPMARLFNVLIHPHTGVSDQGGNGRSRVFWQVVCDQGVKSLAGIMGVYK